MGGGLGNKKAEPTDYRAAIGPVFSSARKEWASTITAKLAWPVKYPNLGYSNPYKFFTIYIILINYLNYVTLLGLT